MIVKKSIVPIEENLYDLSIHGSKDKVIKEESHVYFGKNKLLKSIIILEYFS